MTHSIQKKTFHIQCPNESLANQLYPQISGLSEFKLLPLIEKIVDELCPKDKIIRMGHLNIDLGDIPLGTWEEELVFRFEHEFRRALEEAMGAIKINESKAEEVLDEVQSGLSLLQYILENGTYPWWAESTWALIRQDTSENLSFQQVYDILWDQELWALIGLLRKYYNNPVILLRLIRQLGEARLWELIRVLFPNDIFFLKGLWAELLSLYQKANLSNLTYKAFYEIFWQNVLPFLLRLNHKLTDHQREELKLLLLNVFGFLNIDVAVFGKFPAFKWGSSVTTSELETLIKDYWRSRWPKKDTVLDEFVRLSQSKFRKLSRKDIWLAILKRIQTDYQGKDEVPAVLKGVFVDLLMLSPLDDFRGELLELSKRIPVLGEVLRELDEFQVSLVQKVETLAELLQNALELIIEGLAGKNELDINTTQVAVFLIDFLVDDVFPPYGATELKYLTLLDPKGIDTQIKRQLEKKLKQEKKALLPKLKRLLAEPIARHNFIQNLENDQLQVLAIHLNKQWEVWGASFYKEIQVFRAKYLSVYLQEPQLKQLFWSVVLESLSSSEAEKSKISFQQLLIQQIVNRLALAVPVSEVKFWKDLNKGLKNTEFKLLSKYARISKETLSKKGEQKIILEIWKKSEKLAIFLEDYEQREYSKLIQVVAPVLADFYIQLVLIGENFQGISKEFFDLIWENIWENRSFNTPKRHLEAFIKRILLHQKTISGAFKPIIKQLLTQSDLRKTIVSSTERLLSWVKAKPESTPILIIWAEEIPELRKKMIAYAERHSTMIENNPLLTQWLEQKIQQDPWWKEKSRLNKEQEKLPVIKSQKSPSLDDIIYISNAGLILVHPFLRRLFTILGFTEKNQFINTEVQYRAVHVLQYLVNKQLESDEPSLVLNKIMCGLDLEDPVPTDIVLSEEEKDICDKMLLGLIRQWAILKGVTPDSLRAAFFIRNGRLRYEFEHWELIVEKKGIDVLLDHLPWSISAIQLHWMKDVIHIIWG